MESNDNGSRHHRPEEDEERDERIGSIERWISRIEGFSAGVIATIMAIMAILTFLVGLLPILRAILQEIIK